MAKGKEVEVVEDSKSVVMPMGKRQDAVTALTTLADLKARFGDLADWQDIEPSFQVASKETFEGVPFVIGGFRLNQSKTVARKNEAGELIPTEFVSLLVAGYDENTMEFNTPWVIVNDGSTGIKDQLSRYVRKVNPDVDISLTEFNLTAAEIPPIKCENGLRKSEYPYDDGEQVTTATTWYIA